ncbi:MAG: veratrol--corrinoid protein metyltransferase, partial [Lachnospiraceae bacterium]|nr:veratrol--corrinoid protein metyltransferase [Lachnospiraceae bacterium]
MAQLTEKENYLMCLNGEQPEWIPHIGMGGPKRIHPVAMAEPSLMWIQERPDGDHKDIWGVEYVTSEESAGAYLPKSWDFILDDITKWHDVIKAPNLDEIDFEQMAKHDLEQSKPDRVNQAVSYGAGGVG